MTKSRLFPIVRITVRNSISSVEWYFLHEFRGKVDFFLQRLRKMAFLTAKEFFGLFCLVKNWLIYFIYSIVFLLSPDFHIFFAEVSTIKRDKWIIKTAQKRSQFISFVLVKWVSIYYSSLRFRSNYLHELASDRSYKGL